MITKAQRNLCAIYLVRNKIMLIIGIAKQAATRTNLQVSQSLICQTSPLVDSLAALSMYMREQIIRLTRTITDVVVVI